MSNIDQRPPRINPPRAPFASFATQSHYTQKVPDEATINGLLAIVQTGNIDSIRDYISDNNTGIGMQNSEGQSVLHVVLNNKYVSLTDRQRYELVRYLINKGAPVNARNKENITPLMLACKYQDYDIIKLLLDSGADQMATDNQNMNAIHYLTQAIIEPCKNQEQEQKIGDIIPGESRKLGEVGASGEQKQAPTKEARDLTNIILDVFQEPDFNKFLKSATKSISKSPQIFPATTKEYHKEWAEAVRTITSDVTKTDQEKKKLMADKLKTMASKYDDFLEKDKITVGLKNVIINDDSQFSKVLANTRIELIKKYVEKPDKETPIKLLDQSKIDLDADVANMTKLINSLYAKLGYILYVNTFCRNNWGNDNTALNQDQINKLYCYNIKLSEPMYYVNKIYDNPQISRIIELNNTKRYGSSKYLLSFDEFLATWLNLQETRRDQPYDKTDFMGPRLIPLLAKNLIPLKETDLIKPKCINEEVYFLAKYNYASKSITETVLDIKYKIDNLENAINNNDYAKITNISDLVRNIISIVIDLQTCRDDQDYVVNSITNLTNAITVQTNKKLEDYYLFAWNYAKDVMAKFAVEFDELRTQVITLYDHIRILMQNINKIINLTNEITQSVIIHDYFNPSFSSNEQDKTIKFDDSIKLINLLPNNFDDYYTTYKSYTGDTLRDLEKLLEEQYVEPARITAKYALSETQSRDRAISNAIGDALGDYLGLIKNTIAEELVIIANKNTKTTSVKQNLFDSSKALQTKYIQDLGLTEEKAKNSVLTLLVNLGDTLIIDLFKHTAKTTANNFFRRGSLHATEQGPEINRLLKDLKIDTMPLINTNTDFAVNLNKIYDDITNAFASDLIQASSKRVLQFTAVTVQEPKLLSNHQFKIWDQNIKPKAEQQCYKLNTGILDLFSNRRDLYNARDSSGTTPLQYAISLGIPELVNKLIEKGADSNNPKLKSQNNTTPLSQALAIYKQNLDQINAGNGLYYQIYDPLVEANINALQLKYKNNVMRYVGLIFPMLLTMFNNMFYKHYQTFYNKWSYEDAQNFEALLAYYKLSRPTPFEIPLLKIDFKNLSGTIDDILDKKISENTNIIASQESKAQELQRRIKEIDKLIEQYKNQNKIQNNDLNTSMINYLTKQRNELDTQIESNHHILERDGEYYSQNKQDNSKILEDRVSKFLGSERQTNTQNINQLYQNIFDYVVCSTRLTDPVIYTGYEDFGLYLAMWDRLLKSPELDSISNLHLICVSLQQNLLYNLDQNGPTNISNAYDILNKLYQSILMPISKNLLELPQELGPDKNFVLCEAVGIITHVVRFSMCANMYQSIVKIITRYINSLSSSALASKNAEQTTRDQLVIKLVKYIINPNSIPSREEGRGEARRETKPDPKLERYIVFDMPKHLVKFFLQLYEDQDEDIRDEDRGIISIDQIFGPILEILLNNPAVEITEASSLIVNIKKDVFPYYEELFKAFIPQMLQVLESYTRYIIRDSQQIQIINSLIQKAQKEI